MEHYVYSHINPNTGKCFYIGVGKNKRYRERGTRNSDWVSVVDKNGFTPQILISGLTKKKALKLEVDFISQIGFENLVNKNKGGGGPLTCSDETRSKMIKSSWNKRTIYQYDLKGNYVGDWESAREVDRVLGIDHVTIRQAIAGKIRKTSGGYLWSYKLQDHIEYTPHKNKNIPIKQYTKEGILIKEWDSLKQATQSLNINKFALSNCLAGRIKTSAGFIWKKDNAKKSKKG